MEIIDGPLSCPSTAYGMVVLTPERPFRAVLSRFIPIWLSRGGGIGQLVPFWVKEGGLTACDELLWLGGLLRDI